MDDDGTIIFYESHLRGGAEATVLFCIRQKKPYKHIDIDLVEPLQAVDLLIAFLREYNVGVLNVAGPRASSYLGIYDHVKQATSLALQKVI
ncbi:putative molybdenum carrier protein [Halomonas elongata]